MTTEPGFKIEEKHGCIVVIGSIPVTDMVALLDKVEGRFVCPEASRVLGASMVLGTHEDIEKLKASPEFNERRKQNALEEAKGFNLSEQAINWLVMGERGASSSFMFGYLTGVPLLKNGIMSIPHDGSDFRRCRLLAEEVPEVKENLPKMADASPAWGRLIAQWDELCRVMDEESPEWRDARGRTTKLNALLREARG